LPNTVRVYQCSRAGGPTRYLDTTRLAFHADGDRYVCCSGNPAAGT
jgi:hypothetical protein